MNGPLKFLKFRLFPFAFCLCLLLGLIFRLTNLDQKVFWVDEVATVIRAVGYTKAEIISQLADGQLHSSTDLLTYQQLQPDRTWIDTFTALRQSPEHAPLYFLLVRGWMQSFGSSIAAIRSLSVGLSLLVLPAAYALCRELFREKAISWMAVLLVAISPFFVAYAQEARPYSLWLLTIALSSWALLRAIRLQTRFGWTVYVGALILSFYTSLLSLLVTIGHSLFVIATARSPFNPVMRSHLITVGVALLAFSPWFLVIAQHQSVLADNTTWMRTSISPWSIIAIWLYSFAVLFFDVPVVPTGWVAIVQATLAAAVLLIMGYAVYRLVRTDRRLAGFVGSLILPIPVVLILLDLVFQGQASATPRYLLPSQFGVLLAVAALSRSCHPVLRRHRFGSGQQRIGMLLGLIGLSLMSGWINLDRSPDYQKAHNRENPAIAALINQAERPILLAESTRTMDLLSLSHLLSPTVQIKILPTDRLTAAIPTCQEALLFTPSVEVLTALQQNATLELVYQPQLLTPEDIHLSLWQITINSQSACES